MPWVYLFVAGFLEIVWAVAMKQSAGFTRAGPTALMVVTMVGSFGFLALAMKSLPLGTAYPIWTGIGAVGAFAFGVLVLAEAASPMRVLALALIVAGIVLLKMSAPQ